MAPTVFTKYINEKEVIWQQYRLCLTIAQNQILGGEHFLLVGFKSGKIWCLKKVQHLQKKHHCHWTLLRGRQPKWIFQNFSDLFITTRVCTDLARASGSNGMASSFISWRLCIEGKSDFNSSATVSAICADL